MRPQPPVQAMPELEDVTLVHYEFIYDSGEKDAFTLIDGVDAEFDFGTGKLRFELMRPFPTLVEIDLAKVTRKLRRVQVIQTIKRGIGQCKVCGVKVAPTFELCSKHGGVNA